MKIKEITMAFKKGLPNYGSVNSFITVQVEEGDVLDEVWAYAREQALKNCVEQMPVEDPEWINKDTVVPDIKKEIADMHQEALKAKALKKGVS
jgi:hypothetical protein